MKTQEPIAAQMDEIVFEHRNKNYGAYILRKMYNKQLTRALFIASAVMIAGLAYPLVSSYNALSHGRIITDTGGTIFTNPGRPPEDKPVVPELPASISKIQKQLIFIAPTVVEGEVSGDIDFPGVEGITNTPIIPIDIAEEPVAAKKDDVIEIKAEEPPKLFAEEMPSFLGGDIERLKFLTDNIKYPQLAEENGIKGTVYVQFVVDTKGNITDVKVLRGIGGGCDEEAVRVIKMMPQWHPGKQNGVAVRVLFTMPVVFKLQS
jgi:protein TonB